MGLFGPFEHEAIRAVDYYRHSPGWPGYGLPALLARVLDAVNAEEQRPLMLAPKGNDG